MLSLRGNPETEPAVEVGVETVMLDFLFGKFGSVGEAFAPAGNAGLLVEGCWCLNAPEKEVMALAVFSLLLSESVLLKTDEKSAMLSSPSENRLVSVISYQVLLVPPALAFNGVEFLFEIEGRRVVAETALGSPTRLDLSQCEDVT